jgi:hypothetical protein
MPKFVMPIRSNAGRDRFGKFDDFTRGYIEAMFWADITADDSQALAKTDFEDLAPESLAAAVADCASFQKQEAGCLAKARAKSPGCTAGKAGVDFWCDRNGHGVGFWDGDWPEPEAERLSRFAKSFGSVWVYLGDDGRIYLGKG